MPATLQKASDADPVPYVIERGIPIPVQTRGRGPIPGEIVQALRALARTGAIGDCVLIPGKKAGQIGAYVANAAGTGWTAARTVEGGVRVWKIAEPKARA